MFLNRLWAPWRIGYVIGERASGCIFCQKPRAVRDADELILHRGQQCYVIMNAYPYNNGHLMVVPYEHKFDLADLGLPQLCEMMTLTQLSERVLSHCMAPDGFNIGLNIGRVAGAGIDDHVHLHVVPRWNGDTNFMPVLDDTRVVPQSLRECYELLAPQFAELAKEDVPCTATSPCE